MDQIQDVLTVIRDKKLAKSRLRGVFHVVIGRRITKPDGTLVSAGITWRELANHLRDLRFDPDLVNELEVDVESLSPRDRFKFWYAAIGLAKVESPTAYAEADKLVAALKPLGYIVGPAPTAATVPRFPAVIPLPEEDEDDDAAGKKSPKRKK
jgi:hypothetical protein